MTLPVRFRPRARTALTDAFDWYACERVTLAHAYLAEVDAVITHIRQFPQQFPVVYRETRRALLRRFPYAVFYKVQSDHILVLAILHTKRDLQPWRLREPGVLDAAQKQVA